MLSTRITTALVLLMGFIAAVIWLPQHIFALLCLVVISLGGIEWAKLVGFKSRLSSLLYGLLIFLLGLGAYFSFFIGNAFEGQMMIIMTIMMPFWCLLVPLMLSTPSFGRFPLTLHLMGILILLSAWLAMIWLRTLGLDWFFFPFILVWLTDSLAFFVGRRFGQHKLAPNISPGKTWEGAIAAVITVTFLGSMAYLFYGTQLGVDHKPLWQAALGFLALCILSIIGDLFESLVKRRAGVKDSGILLPGHGGILDRIDALLAVLPVAAWLSMHL